MERLLTMSRAGAEPIASVRLRLTFALIAVVMIVWGPLTQGTAWTEPLTMVGSGIAVGLGVFELLSRAGRWRLALCARAWIAAFALMALSALAPGPLSFLAVGAFIVLRRLGLEARLRLEEQTSHGAAPEGAERVGGASDVGRERTGPLVGVWQRLLFSTVGLGLMLLDTVVLQEHTQGFLFWFGAGLALAVTVFDALSLAGRWRIVLRRWAWLGAFVLAAAAVLLQAGRLAAFAVGATCTLLRFAAAIDVGGRQRRGPR
jgi:hypothetical protein